jgi:hypothetical protein
MTSPATIKSSLQIIDGPLKYTQPTQGTFLSDMTGLAGPTPGQILVSTSHTEPSFTQITANGGVTGLCFLANIDELDYVEYGLYDSSIAKFLPVGELWVGEAYVIRLSRFLGRGLTPGVGTGTAGTDLIYFSLKAVGAPTQVIVDAFAA